MNHDDHDLQGVADAAMEAAAEVAAQDELAHKRAKNVGAPDTLRDFINSGVGMKEKFLSVEEVRDSEGDGHIEPVPGKGWRITVENGSVLGWLFLAVNNLQQQNANQQALLHTAGAHIRQLEAQLAGEAPKQPGQRMKSGLIVP